MARGAVQAEAIDETRESEALFMPVGEINHLTELESVNFL